jgi:hypothetical protein
LGTRKDTEKLAADLRLLTFLEVQFLEVISDILSLKEIEAVGTVN